MTKKNKIQYERLGQQITDINALGIITKNLRKLRSDYLKESAKPQRVNTNTRNNIVNSLISDNEINAVALAIYNLLSYILINKIAKKHRDRSMKSKLIIYFYGTIRDLKNLLNSYPCSTHALMDENCAACTGIPF